MTQTPYEQAEACLEPMLAAANRLYQEAEAEWRDWEFVEPVNVAQEREHDRCQVNLLVAKDLFRLIEEWSRELGRHHERA